MIDEQYYVYRHIRLDKDQVFYVGIGKKSQKKNAKSHKTIYDRAYSLSGRSNFWKGCAKGGIKIEIIFETNDPIFLETKEKEFIKLYGRRNLGLGTLVNLTDGGRGLPGLRHSLPTCNKIKNQKKSFINKYTPSVIKLYHEGLTINEIASKLGIVRHSVTKIMKLNNLSTRTGLKSQKFYYYNSKRELLLYGTILEISKLLGLSYGGTRNIIERGTSKKYIITKNKIIC